GYAMVATNLAMNYAFSVLNMHKLYLIVDKENEKAIHIYKKVGFSIEGELKDEFFVDGSYHNAIRMCMFQKEYLQTKNKN
ncbi:GNAT family N-acetyltransferase, partial [Bacillus licheniformis]